MRIKLLLLTCYLNGGLHAVLSGNRLNGCQIFGWFGFSKTESEPNFGFLHIPTCREIHALPFSLKSV